MVRIGVGILLLLIIGGCARYTLDDRIPACRDKKTGQFVNMEMCE